MSVVAVPASYKPRNQAVYSHRRLAAHSCQASASRTSSRGKRGANEARAYATSGLARRGMRKLARYEVGTLLSHPFGAGWRDQHDSAARR